MGISKCAGSRFERLNSSCLDCFSSLLYLLRFIALLGFQNAVFKRGTIFFFQNYRSQGHALRNYRILDRTSTASINYFAFSSRFIPFNLHSKTSPSNHTLLQLTPMLIMYNKYGPPNTQIQGISSILCVIRHIWESALQNVVLVDTSLWG